jgi:ATP-dependent Clp protease ATP-binding subunit ClpA
MFERFTERARRVVVLAQEEARLLNHNYIGTEHLLLGLLREGEGVAAGALTSMGIELEAVRSQVEEIIGQGAAEQAGHIPFTPRAKKVLELSLREAHQLGHNYIGTEHILLGLVREAEGVAAQVLVAFGAGMNQVRQQVTRLLASAGQPEPEGEAPGSEPGRRLGPEGFRSTAFGESPEHSASRRRERLARIEELAREEATRLGHADVDSVHRWLGYLRLEEEGATQDLSELRDALDLGRRRAANLSQPEDQGPERQAPDG